MDRLPLKVLHICQRDDPATGGAVRVAVEYVTRLQSYGVDAHILFLYGQPSHFQTQLQDSAHYLNIHNSKEVWKFARLSRFIKRFQPDVVHHHDGLMWSNLLTTVHPNYRKFSHAHLGTSTHTSPVKGSITAWLQKRSVDALVCIARTIQQDYLTKGNYSQTTTHVICNGVDTHVFHPPSMKVRQSAKEDFGWELSTPVVGYLGRLDCKMKGVDDFIHVLSELPDHVKGLVVGEGPDRSKLEDLVGKHNLTERVRFTGNLNHTYPAYCAMDVFCLTSHREPFGLTVVEAMACGIPVVGFPCEGGVNEILSAATGFVLTNRKPKSMAKTVIRILKTGLAADQKVTIHRKISTEYCWDKNTEKLAALYQSVI